jgi:citrate lyase subunit beta/citryl-CoA lyase
MTGRGTPVRNARTLLFVPGSRPKRFAKALASGADGVILDLEDAVPDADKAEARRQVEAWVEREGVVVRVNDCSSPHLEEDLAMLAGKQATVMLAKTESATEVRRVLDALTPGSQMLPLVETAAGVLASPSICAEPGVVRAALGGVDLASQLKITDPASPTLTWSYAMVVVASAAAGIGVPLASPTLQIDATARVLEDCRRARAMGLGGKLCIHPAQVAAAHEAFAPTGEEVAWARHVLAAEASGAATQLDGQMLDRPVFDRARWILASTSPTAAATTPQKEPHR